MGGLKSDKGKSFFFKCIVTYTLRLSNEIKKS